MRIEAGVGLAVLGRRLAVSGCLLSMLLGGPARAAGRPDVCTCSGFESLAENLGLWSFRRSTGKADRAIARKLPPGTSQLSFRASDGKRLTGYRIACEPEGGPRAKGYLLVAQGDAMLASDPALLDSLKQGLCDGVSEIYLFDYRGTGLSKTGNGHCLGDIVQDYRELIAFVGERNPQAARRAFYGISAGAVLLLNALSAAQYSSLVLDSLPDRLPVDCWTRAFDPVARIPADARSLAVLYSPDDSIVGPDQMQRVLDKARQGQATVIGLKGLPHFHLDDPGQRRQRLAQVSSVLR